MNTTFKKFATGTAALALMTTVFASAAMAEVSNPVITGGTLDLKSTVTLNNAFTLTGKDEVYNVATFDNLTVTDPTGSGSGWSVQLSATPFTTTALVPVKILSGNVLTISEGNVDEHLEAPNSSPAEQISIDRTGYITETAKTIVTAGTDEGSGTYDITGIKLNLAILPKDVRAVVYSSTITTQIISGGM